MTQHRTLPGTPPRRAQSGSIAIETAFAMLFLLVFIAIPLFLGRVLWYYSVAEKAAHDGARFLSNVAQHEIVGAAGSGGQVPIAKLAEAIANAEVEEIKPALDWHAIGVLCDLDVCGSTIPQTVRVSVQLRIRDNFFGPITREVFAEDALTLNARVTMRYVGN